MKKRKPRKFTIRGYPEGYNERIVFRRKPKGAPGSVGVLRYYQKPDGTGEGAVRIEPQGYKLKKIALPFKGVSSQKLQERYDNYPPGERGYTEYYQMGAELKRRGYEKPAPVPAWKQASARIAAADKAAQEAKSKAEKEAAYKEQIAARQSYDRDILPGQIAPPKKKWGPGERLEQEKKLTAKLQKSYRDYNKAETDADRQKADAQSQKIRAQIDRLREDWNK